MFKKIIIISLIIFLYIYIVSSDTDRSFFYKAKNFYKTLVKKYKDMDLKYDINKL